MDWLTGWLAAGEKDFISFFLSLSALRAPTEAVVARTGILPVCLSTFQVPSRTIRTYLHYVYAVVAELRVAQSSFTVTATVNVASLSIQSGSGDGWPHSDHSS